MQRITRILFALPLAAKLFAGGFWVELGTPAASPEATKKGAVLVARVTGCHDPTKAAVTATAEGIVDGKRQSVELTPIPLSAPGTYAVKREWAANGMWAVKVIATTNGLAASVVVRMDGNGFDRGSAKYFHRDPTPEEIASVISGDTKTTATR